MRPDVLDALLWNRPALEGRESTAAIEFIDAMDLRPLKGDADDDEPLSVAAHGVIAEFSDDHDDALRAYRRLQESGDSDRRLLGLFLLCWSDLEKDPERVADATREIEQLQDLHLRARLTSKLVAAAFDHGWDDLIPDLLEQAQEWADPGSRLAVMLEREAMNLVDGPFPEGWTRDPDPLTEYRWISDKAAGAAEKALATGVEEAAKAPWLLSFSIGATPLNQPVAAEMQARWAGAIWLRNEMQTQLAAHLLRGGASTSQGYATGVSLWCLGSGRQLRDVIDAAEPHFDSNSADFIVRSLMRSGPVARRFNTRLVEAALECWDLISDELAAELLRRFQPSDSHHPIARQVAALWGVMSLRAPDVFEERLAALADEDARGLLAVMSPTVAERIPQSAAIRLYELVGTSDELPADAFQAITALIDRLDPDEIVLPEGDLPPRVVASLAWRGSEVVDQGDLQNAIRQLTEKIEQLVAEAKKGTGQWPPESPFVSLAAASARADALPDRLVSLLIGLSEDPQILRNIRYDAVKALAAAVAYGAISADTLRNLIPKIPEAGAETVFAPYPPQLVRSAKTELAMACGLVTDFLPDLLILSRDSDARVRIDAIEGAILGRQTANLYQLESILLGGLFDPSTKVVQRAVNGFSEQLPQDPAVRAALTERLEILYDIGDRDTRAAIARFSSHVDPTDGLNAVAKPLRERAEGDRSFEVRLAVDNPPARS
jgi:hypothetical protein